MSRCLQSVLDSHPWTPVCSETRNTPLCTYLCIGKDLPRICKYKILSPTAAKSALIISKLTFISLTSVSGIYVKSCKALQKKYVCSNLHNSYIPENQSELSVAPKHVKEHVEILSDLSRSTVVIKVIFFEIGSGNDIIFMTRRGER